MGDEDGFVAELDVDADAGEASESPNGVVGHAIEFGGESAECTVALFDVAVSFHSVDGWSHC